MIRRMVIMLALVALLFGAIFGFQAFKGKMIRQYMAGMANQLQTVSTVVAETHQWQPQLSAVGTLKAVKGADLAFDVSGIVDAISFNSGDEVAAGTPLVRLKDADDLAKLRALEATAELANIVYQRDSRQLAAQAISQATVDSDAANLKNARAQQAQQQALLDKKTLRAPFEGRLGIRAVDLGQFVNSGSVVVTLQALDPIFVDFYMPQQSLAEMKVGQPVVVGVDTYPDLTFAGKIAAIEPKVDSSSRNVMVRASVANPDRKLLPGMFARVQVDTGAPVSQVTLPQTAITFNPYGDTIYRVENQGNDDKGKPKLVATQTFVTTGERRGDQIVVLTGVKAGDEIVASGQLKLRNGSPLAIDNSVRPKNDANPKPVDK